MMALPYTSEDMECAAAARNTMIQNNGNSTYYYTTEESVGNYSTDSQVENNSLNNSLTTNMLVGTFYNPNNASDTNSFVSSLQDELSNSGHPRDVGSLSLSLSKKSSSRSNKLSKSGSGSGKPLFIEWKDMFRKHTQSQTSQLTSKTLENNAADKNVDVEDDHDNHDINTTSNSIPTPTTVEIYPWKDPADPGVVTIERPRRRKWIWVTGMCLLVVIAVIVGVVVGVNNGGNTQNTVNVGMKDESGNAAADRVDDQNSTSPVETDVTTNDVAASEVPTNVPTMAPSIVITTNNPTRFSNTQVINEFVRSLPPYTRQALDVSRSPQQRALNWLTTDPSLTSYTMEQLLQRYVLKVFFYATGGDDEDSSNGAGDSAWSDATGWSEPPVLHECQWFSTFEDESIEPPCNEQGVVTVLSLRNNNLQGSIPKELSLLINLEVVDLSSNAIQSSIPTELGLLTNLNSFAVNGNELSGTIPSEFGQLMQLEVLPVQDNNLSGQVPLQLCALFLLEITIDCEEVACYCGCGCSTVDAKEEP